jgi:hypothetical protein
MARRFWLVVILALTTCSMLWAATKERPMLVNVDINNKSALEILRHGNFDIACISKDGIADIVADDADYQRLQSAGLNPIIVHGDLVAFYQSREPLEATMGGFRTFSEVIALMDSLHTLYPSITTARDSIGASYQGRAIWMMKISDNPDSNENEPQFFINGLIHAREPMGMEATVRFAQYLCQNYGTDSLATYLVNNREFYFVPVVNPDGYEYNRQTNPSGGGMWRKNRHGQGIDLNRNWGYEWGYDDVGSSPNPGDDTYRGTGPFSEPETEVLREFIDAHHFSIIMNFHTYGGDCLYPWGYVAQHTPDQAIFSTIADSCVASNGYSPGTPWELLYFVNGESCDWDFGEQTEKPKIFGFVMEIGDNSDGFWPLPSRIVPIWNSVRPSLLYLARIAENPYAVGAPAAPVLNFIGDIYNDTITTIWSSHDTLNPAVFFELKELVGFQRMTDSFDSSAANWTLHGFVRRTTRHHSGTYSLFSGSQNNYNGTATLANPITINSNDTLKFWTWYSIENSYDYAYVQLSTDGGATFANLAGNITTNNNPNGNNQGNGITGNSNAWVQGKFPLEAYVGQSATIILRYVTDPGTLGEGFYVDDFFPVETFQQQNILGSNITDTSFVVAGRPEGTYYYQVRAQDAQGQWSGFSNREVAIVHPLTSVNDQPILPLALSLSQNYPNPFNPTTNIEFVIGAPSNVKLAIFDITGQAVKTLMNSHLNSGRFHLRWDGTDDKDLKVSSGIYFYKLTVADKSIVKKMTLLK